MYIIINHVTIISEKSIDTYTGPHLVSGESMGVPLGGIAAAGLGIVEFDMNLERVEKYSLK